MAAKTEVTQAPPKEVVETSDGEPLLDLPDAAVKKLIRSAKKRGYVTHDQIRSLSCAEGGRYRPRMQPPVRRHSGGFH
jgi:RNA polymerase primary sigma factor